MNLLPLLSLIAVCVSPRAQDADDAAKLQIALRRLNGMTDPVVVANRDTLRAVLERYYTDRPSMTHAEFQIVQEFIEVAGTNRVTGYLTTLSPKTPKKATGKPARTAGSGVRFTTAVRPVPGVGDLGIVEMRRNGQRTTLIEIYTGAGMNVGKRAGIIADRFQRLDAQDPWWWTKLKVGRFGAATIVSNPRADKGIVVTADPLYAKACNQSPPGLAQMLIRKIREGVDPGNAAARRAAGEETPEDLRDAAVAARQEGDALTATKPKAAVQEYKRAIEIDPAYAVPYLRLAATYVRLHDAARAKAILEQGLAEGGVAEPDKAALRAALSRP